MNWPQYALSYQLEDTHWWFAGRRDLAQQLLARWVAPAPDARLLDVGCGTGGNLQALAGQWTAHGLDISPAALHFARRRPLRRLLQGSGLALPYPASSFEAVTGFDVLYHRWITDDSRALREMARVLKPGGWLLLTDSALPRLWSSHDERYFARQRYTLPQMQARLAQAGFAPRLCSYTNFLLLPVVALVRLTMDRLPIYGNIDRAGAFPGWLNSALTRVRTLEAGWLGHGHTLPIGGSLVCLAQKKE
ncbi:MAG: class I SAM-dependent methyltransferase [Anaerolineae bacterium]